MSDPWTGRKRRQLGPVRPALRVVNPDSRVTLEDLPAAELAEVKARRRELRRQRQAYRERLARDWMLDIALTELERSP